MSRVTIHLVVPLALAVALSTFGCASPPTAEKKEAEDAINAAKSAGAEKYASSDFQAATSALKEAETHMGAKKYSEAKVAYVKIKDLAEKAAKAVEGGKAAMKSQVEQALNDTEKRWQALESNIKKMAKKLKAEQKQAWEADAKGAVKALQAAKVTAGADPATAKEKLAAATSALEKWEAELKACATPVKEAGKPAKK